MSDPQTSTDLRNVTFSQALEAGLTHYDSLVCPKTLQCGPDHVLASHSVVRESVEALLTRDTCGPLFGGLSPNAGLQRSLENRLRQSLQGLGGPEYKLTWKHWDIEAQPPICALRASAHRTSDNGCFGWPSPKASDTSAEKPETKIARNKKLRDAGHPGCGSFSLSTLAMSGWATPNVQNSKHATLSESEKMNEQGTLVRYSKSTGQTFGVNLRDMARIAGYPTPVVNDSTGSKYAYSQGNHDKPVLKLPGVAAALGPTQSSYLAETEKRGVLNADLSRWLLGYPEEWGYCGVTAMQSCQRLQRNSSKQRKDGDQ